MSPIIQYLFFLIHVVVAVIHEDFLESNYSLLCRTFYVKAESISNVKVVKTKTSLLIWSAQARQAESN